MKTGEAQELIDRREDGETAGKTGWQLLHGEDVAFDSIVCCRRLHLLSSCFYLLIRAFALYLVQSDYSAICKL